MADHDVPLVPWDGVNPPQCDWFPYYGCWYCHGKPPPPWPHDPPGGWWDPAIYGAPGTLWQLPDDWREDVERSTGERIFRTLLKKLAPIESPQGGGWECWRVPPLAPHDPQQRWTEMRYARVNVVGKLGTVEMVSHGFNLRTAPTVDVDQDVAAIQTLANQVRDIWAAWFNGSMPNGMGVKALFSPELTYSEVRAAYVQSTAVGERRVLPNPGHKNVIKYVYQKPTYLVDTQYAPFAAGVTGTGAQSLPWEVACVMSLDSGRRGAANRGRTYLGPLAADIMGGAGLFDAGRVTALSDSFANGVIKQINLLTGCDVHVVSKFWNDSIPVNSVRAGLVPDSQRRRRGNQVESYRGSIVVPLTAP